MYLNFFLVKGESFADSAVLVLFLGSTLRLPAILSTCVFCIGRYEVLYHVNITDVDDKIIKRARRNKLIVDFLAANMDAAAFEKASEV